MKKLIVFVGATWFAGHASGQDISIDQMTEIWGQAQAYCIERYGAEDPDMLNECTEMRARVIAKKLNPEHVVPATNQAPTMNSEKIEADISAEAWKICRRLFSGEKAREDCATKKIAFQKQETARAGKSQVVSTQAVPAPEQESTPRNSHAGARQFCQNLFSDQGAVEDCVRQKSGQSLRQVPADTYAPKQSGKNTAAAFGAVLRELNFNSCVSRGGTPITSPGGMVTCQEKRPQTTTCRGSGNNTVNCTTY